LIDRLTDHDLETLANFVQTFTNRHCTKSFARQIATAARKAPSMDDLMALFREKIAAGHGPKKGNGWFLTVARDHYGGYEDPEDVLASGEFGKLGRVGVPEDYHQAQRWNEWKLTGIVPPQ
jgi:hypothetical protein